MIRGIAAGVKRYRMFFEHPELGCLWISQDFPGSGTDLKI